MLGSCAAGGRVGSLLMSADSSYCSARRRLLQLRQVLHQTQALSPRHCSLAREEGTVLLLHVLKHAAKQVFGKSWLAMVWLCG